MTRIQALSFLIFFSVTQLVGAQEPILPRSSPEAQGVSSTSIAAFVQAADKKVNTMHSFMLLRHGVNASVKV